MFQSKAFFRSAVGRVTRKFNSGVSARYSQYGSLISLSSTAENLIDVNKDTVLQRLIAVGLIACFAFQYGVDSDNITKLDAAMVQSPVEEEDEKHDADEKDETTMLLNWSGTHAVHVSNDSYFEPETIEELESIVRLCHDLGKPVRPLGSALSPNGIGFHSGGMVSLSNLDKIVKVDKENMTVTVQAGARVSQVVDALRPHRLTLPNLASIAEQQMGGFVQVGAHGTGARIAPVDEYVTELTLVTPGKGTIKLRKGDELFDLAKVGLGCLGIVAEVTMKCIPAHKLVEHTFVLSRKEAKEQLHSLLESHKHVRYMWIPYEDAVVVVTNDPESDVPQSTPRKTDSSPDRFRPLQDLLVELTADQMEPTTLNSMEGMGFGELRDSLLAVNPLNVEHVKRCNKAEADFWRQSEGYQTKPSDELLQFDCGGQQWVWEVCFPTGDSYESNGNDIKFMEKLLAGIEEQGIAAHSPIEQRWTSSSSSLMSPAHGPPGQLFSWVGIIMYLPSDDERQRREITDIFKGQYCDLLKSVGANVNSVSHWAKLEIPGSVWKILDLQQEMQQRYPVDQFNHARALLDPKNILANQLINLAMGTPLPQRHHSLVKVKS